MSPVRRSRSKQKPDPEPSPVVTIEGVSARAVLPEGPEARMDVGELFEELDAGLPDTRDLLLPDGTQAIVPTRAGFLLVHQSSPAVHGFRWIAEGSPEDYGQGTAYRQVRLALPHVIVIAGFHRVRGGCVQLGRENECFFSVQPLRRQGMATPLCFPALLNCSRYPSQAIEHPLSWICTQHLPREEYAHRTTLDAAVRDGLQALVRHLLETGFNRSSEHHEGSSWFTETVKAGIDPRLASVEAWEDASLADPQFVREVPWLPTGKTLGEVIERVRLRFGGPPASVHCAGDIARVVINQSNRQGALAFGSEP